MKYRNHYLDQLIQFKDKNLIKVVTGIRRSGKSTKGMSSQDKFNQYLQYGGLPTIIELLDNPDTIDPFLEGIYNTVLMKDVIERNGVRDAALLKSITSSIWVSEIDWSAYVTQIMVTF